MSNLNDASFSNNLKLSGKVFWLEVLPFQFHGCSYKVLSDDSVCLICIYYTSCRFFLGKLFNLKRLPIAVQREYRWRYWKRCAALKLVKQEMSCSLLLLLPFRPESPKLTNSGRNNMSLVVYLSTQQLGRGSTRRSWRRRRVHCFPHVTWNGFLIGPERTRQWHLTQRISRGIYGLPELMAVDTGPTSNCKPWV